MFPYFSLTFSENESWAVVHCSFVIRAKIRMWMSQNVLMRLTCYKALPTCVLIDTYKVTTHNHAHISCFMLLNVCLDHAMLTGAVKSNPKSCWVSVESFSYHSHLLVTRTVTCLLSYMTFNLFPSIISIRSIRKPRTLSQITGKSITQQNTDV